MNTSYIKTKILLWIVAPLLASSACAYDRNEIRELERLANDGNIEAMYWLGAGYGGFLPFYDFEGIPDYPKGAMWLKKATNAGHLEATFKYAYMLAAGLGVRENEEEALRLFKICAEHKHALAAYNAGSLLLKKKKLFGMIKNSEAKHWFGLGCDYGSDMSCRAYNNFDDLDYVSAEYEEHLF